MAAKKLDVSAFLPLLFMNINNSFSVSHEIQDCEPGLFAVLFIPFLLVHTGLIYTFMNITWFLYTCLALVYLVPIAECVSLLTVSEVK